MLHHVLTTWSPVCAPMLWAQWRTALDAVDGSSIGFALAPVLADLARTRERLLDELSVA